jgi:hypothetical protein
VTAQPLIGPLILRLLPWEAGVPLLRLYMVVYFIYVLYIKLFSPSLIFPLLIHHSHFPLIFFYHTYSLWEKPVALRVFSRPMP